MPTGIEVVLDGHFACGRAQLLEPARLDGSEGLVDDVRERRATPEGERFPRGALSEQALELSDVDLAAVDLKLVAAAMRHDCLCIAGVCECLPQMRDVELNQLPRGRRRVLAPQPVDQLLRRDGDTGFKRK